MNKVMRDSQIKFATAQAISATNWTSSAFNVGKRTGLSAKVTVVTCSTGGTIYFEVLDNDSNVLCRSKTLTITTATVDTDIDCAFVNTATIGTKVKITCTTAVVVVDGYFVDEVV
jgi:hypothetical protein